MRVATKYLAGVIALSALMNSCGDAQLHPDQLERGGEWLSWGPGERARYVNGFISGYLRGFHGACDVADELFEVGKPRRLGNGQYTNDMPSTRCLERMEEYSKVRYAEASGPDFSAYADVITEFYTRHPEYQGIPFPYLMGFLGDTKYATADQLYQMALKGEMRTRF